MTINELAKMAGVSISTVSKVMNNKDSSISKATRERILELAKEYHYSPPSSPLSKKTRTLTIGVVFRSSGRINLTLNGILDAAQEKGYTPLLRESRDDLSTERKNLLAVIVTEHGVFGEKALSIVTPSDFPRINRFLENYNAKPF